MNVIHKVVLHPLSKSFPTSCIGGLVIEYFPPLFPQRFLWFLYLLSPILNVSVVWYLRFSIFILSQTHLKTEVARSCFGKHL